MLHFTAAVVVYYFEKMTANNTMYACKQDHSYIDADINWVSAT